MGDDDFEKIPKSKKSGSKEGKKQKLTSNDDDEEDSSNEKHDFGDVAGGLFSSIPWVMAFLLLLLYLFINSNIFINDILKPMYPDAIDIDRTNNLGTVISGVVFVLGYLIIDILKRCDVL